MGWKLFDIDHREAVPVENGLDRPEREVREVLVVDRVELVLRQQPHEMRHLDRQQAVRCKQLRQSSDEVVDVRDLREGVVAGNQIGLAALALELVGKVTSEESRQGANSGGFRRPGDILGGLDAQHGNPCGDEVAQQIAIVAAHFDDEAVRSELQLPLHLFGIASDVLEPAG